MRLTISFKIVLVTALLTLALGAAQVLVGARLLIPSFDALERDNARIDMDRVENALHGELDQLAVATRDYGDWTELYRFMEDRDSRNVAALSPQQFLDLGVDVLILLDSRGQMVWSLVSPPGTRTPGVLDSSSPPAYVADLPWRTAVAAGETAQGILSSHDGPLLASLAPVLNGQGNGPARGAVLLGRYLTPAQIARLSAQAHVRVRLVEDHASPGSGAELPLAAAAVPPLNDSIRERESITEVDRVFRDAVGDPVFTLRAEVPRTISRHGRRIVAFATMSLTVIGALILGAQLIALRRMVLEPLAHLTNHAIEIGRQDSVAKRLDIRRGDEIGVLAREFDRMIERLGMVRRQLIDRSFAAGVGEMASGALHNIGNAITPLTVRIGNLRQRLQAVPTADVEPAIGALASSRGDAERRADCEKFLGLVARDCAHAIVRGDEELGLVQRQLDDVKRLLAEQRNCANRGAVVEETSVAEILCQAAEVVPSDLRALLAIDIDPSIRAIGTQWLPRTVLQQVAQNIVLNAAQAVREGGGTRGILYVNATPVSTCDGRKPVLELTFSDDGIGIAPEHLPRLFERGFSTKSRATNSGFGLHWCANALNALGGDIEATSAGRGRGACFRIRVPLRAPPDAADRHAA